MNAPAFVRQVREPPTARVSTLTTTIALFACVVVMSNDGPPDSLTACSLSAAPIPSLSRNWRTLKPNHVPNPIPFVTVTVSAARFESTTAVQTYNRLRLAAVMLSCSVQVIAPPELSVIEYVSSSSSSAANTTRISPAFAENAADVRGDVVESQATSVS